jgi:hypothetical protein
MFSQQPSVPRNSIFRPGQFDPELTYGVSHTIGRDRHEEPGSIQVPTGHSRLLSFTFLGNDMHLYILDFPWPVGLSYITVS